MVAESAETLWPAPAKINLFLRVLGRRADGYHELQTLFQLLDWGDRLRIRLRSDRRIRRVAANYDVAETDDLAVRAARLLQLETACGQGADLAIDKAIPPGSGMGGGSSDAATVLLALNRLWGCGLDRQALSSLALRLGADVPVFVQGHTALATGVGEKLEPLRLGERHYVLVFSEIFISTAAVFADPGLSRNSPPLPLERAVVGDDVNDCETLVRKRFPAFDRHMRELERWGQPRMTGTGSGVFISMPDAAQAIRAAEDMKNLYNVRAVRGVDRSPALELLDGR